MNKLLVAAASCLVGCTAAPRSLELKQGPLYREIAVLEDARDLGGEQLLAFMRHPDRDLRARAATALGRMPFPEHGAQVTAALIEGLSDGDARVRAAVAFALGMRGDPAAGDALLELAVDPERRDPVPLVRARAVEAGSKLDRPDLRLRLIDARRDEDSSVRLEAVEGAHRWSRDEPTADQIDQLLIDHMAWDAERDVLAMTLFSLQRRRAPAALDTFLEHATSRFSPYRIWSVRGLAALAPDERALAGLVVATRDPDWRVACEATTGLGAYDLGVESATLLAATGHRRQHVRRLAWEALARRLARVDDPAELGHATAWRALFDERGPRHDPSPDVRAAFGAALVHYERLAGTGQLSLGAVQTRLASGATTPEEWIAFAAALGQGPPSPNAGPILRYLARLEDLRIAGAALGALGHLPGPETRAFLHEALTWGDNGLRLAAVLALREMTAPEDLEPLAQVYRSSTGDIGPEVRFNALRVVGLIGGDRARVILLEGLSDEDPYVRRVARGELETRWPEARLDELALAAPPTPRAAVPRPGQDYRVYRKNPRVKVETTKGDLIFELFPREAPIHVHNFLTLADRDHYDGTLFHRVVPDFVIQGGDYRGDGNGGTTYRGADSLRHEIGPRKFVRGSLGTPRNEDLESGGSQIFVTHRSTPHLDGRYTIFGELREGFGVLEAIEVGDRILDVRRVSSRR